MHYAYIKIVLKENIFKNKCSRSLITTAPVRADWKLHKGNTFEDDLNHVRHECLQSYWNGFHCGQDSDNLKK